MSHAEASFNLFEYFLGSGRLSGIGDRTALEFGGERISYHALRASVDRWAARLLKFGAGRGDRVALLLRDSPDFIASFLAAVSIGAISVPINTFLREDEIDFILNDSGACLLITEPALQGKVTFWNQEVLVTGQLRQERAGLQEVESARRRAGTTRRSAAFMLYTSGSTGNPKGVLHVHGSIPVTVENYSRSVLRLSSEDRVYSSSRLFFAYGLGNSLSFPLAEGATVVLDAERPSPESIFGILAEKKITVFFGVPAVYNSLLDYCSGGVSADLSRLRLCLSAGEALPDRIFHQWAEVFGRLILDGIGSTEMLHIFISNREGEAQAGSSGTVVDGYEAKLVGEDGGHIEGEGTGALWVRGESAMAGYWKRDDLTESAIREGWVRTGDIYNRRGDGFYCHVGRSDDCFKVKGLWVSPVEIESALTSHPSVKEAAVVPGVGETGLATAHAYVVIREGEPSTEMTEELLQFLIGRLPRHKVPSQIEFIGELPRTSTGKVQRFKLKATDRS